MKNGGFKIICPDCGHDNCDVSAFLVSSQITYSGHIGMVMIVCPECETEWNEMLAERIIHDDAYYGIKS